MFITNTYEDKLIPIHTMFGRNSQGSFVSNEISQGSTQAADTVVQIDFVMSGQHHHVEGWNSNG